MTEMIEFRESAPLTFTQRWNTYLAIVLAAGVMVLGITLRDSNLNATVTLENLESGVRAQVPANWLQDTAGDEYLFRVRDPGALPFKTTLQVSVLTVGPDATPDLVLNLLTMQRSSRFATYHEISRSDATLRDDPAKRMVYAYTEFERNPSLQSLPMVIEGVDLVVLQGTQAVVVTYREEQSAFDDHLYRFENLLRTLEIF